MTAPAKRRIALMPAAPSGPTMPSVPPAGRLRTTPLPSQKTWTAMIERLEAKYGRRQRTKKKTRRRKKKARKGKKKKPSKKAQRAFRAKMRAMVKRGKSVVLETSLRRLMQRFPQADHALKVYPKRGSLYSTVGRVPGAKCKLNTFL